MCLDTDIINDGPFWIFRKFSCYSIVSLFKSAIIICQDKKCISNDFFKEGKILKGILPEGAENIPVMFLPGHILIICRGGFKWLYVLKNYAGDNGITIETLRRGKEKGPYGEGIWRR